ncbi:MAG: CPBP family intramembrane glutamic endopeptidase [Bacteroidaceae bacterium]
MKHAVYLVLLFIGVQLFSGWLGNLLLNIPHLQSGAPLDVTLFSKDPTALGLSLLFSDVVLIAFTLFLVKTQSKHISVLLLFLSVLVTLPVLFLVNILTESLHVPDTMNETFYGMKDHWICVFAIAVVGPIAEEVVFRRGILGSLLTMRLKPWCAILLSSILFGVIHFNPTQMIGATLIGILFGWFYYRTGNLLPSILAHITNNTIGICQLHFTSSPTASTKDLIGNSISLGLLVSIALCLACVLLICFYKQTKSHTNDESPLETI